MLSTKGPFLGQEKQQSSTFEYTVPSNKLEYHGLRMGRTAAVLCSRGLFRDEIRVPAILYTTEKGAVVASSFEY